MEHTLRILSITSVTHNVRCIRFEKPEGYTFVPGHAADVSINKPGWEQEKRPFTFTCLNEQPYLEFTIKSYTDHDGVTKQISLLQPGDELIISDSWGAIEYKGEGYFLAGGAGITPFMAILRQLHKDKALAGNKLFFSNKTANDVIYEEELRNMLGQNAIFLITDDKTPGYVHDYMDDRFIQSNIHHFNKHFYICGPDPMIKSLSGIVTKHGADPEVVVFEK